MPEEALGGRSQPPFLAYRDSPVWTRKYSERDEGRCSCEDLQKALAAMPGAERMVVGHTIQVRVAQLLSGAVLVAFCRATSVEALGCMGVGWEGGGAQRDEDDRASVQLKDEALLPLLVRELVC